MNKKSNTLHKIKHLRNVSAKHRKFDKIRTTTGTAAFIYADIIGFERVYLSYLFVSKAKGNKKMVRAMSLHLLCLRTGTAADNGYM